LHDPSFGVMGYQDDFLILGRSGKSRNRFPFRCLPWVSRCHI
jgi:hypothetical protein